MPVGELMDALVRLSKFKKENKELLTYLLFEKANEANFIRGTQNEIEELFSGVDTESLYFAKKTIRKILRRVNKYAQYSGLATTNIELLIHFCGQMDNLKIDIHQSTTMQNLYMNQVKKIKKLIGTLHEDLQFDYQDRIAGLRDTKRST